MVDLVLVVDGKGLVLLVNLVFSECCGCDLVGEWLVSLFDDEILEDVLVE